MPSSDPVPPFNPLLHDVTAPAVWLVLGQAWRQRPQPGFQRGGARVEWDGSGLRYEAVFAAHAPKNRARRLNERTWELGDVCEIFIQLAGHSEYLELHVTPENQRLQLRWTEESHAAFAGGAIPLKQAFVDDADWVVSSSKVESGHWRIAAHWPNRTLGLPEKGSGRLSFRTAVCRYDCESDSGPILSSTAALRELSFHRLGEWNALELPRG